MSDGATFGRAAVAAAGVEDLLTLEASAGKAGRFAAVDRLVGDLLLKALRAERPLIALARARNGDALSIIGLGTDRREVVDEWFSIERQQARGAWFLPEQATLRVGLVNLSAHLRTQPRYASGLAAEERGRVAFKGSPEAVLVWAILEPLFEQLLLPLELRGPQAGAKDRDAQLQAWADVDRFLEGLGLRVADELAVMRYGGGWHRLRAPEQVEAKRRLLDALAAQVDRSTAVRYRALSIRAFLAQYYARAAKGPPLRRRVVTREHERPLAGFFGGDWLAFLEYAGEEPHPDERIATALPETRLYVGGSRAPEVAARQGLPVEEVERMLAVFWGGSSASPVERRVAALGRYWRIFDEVHARQAPGMPPLWGLVEDVRSIDFGGRADVPYQGGLYRRLLPADLVAEIEQLWGTVMLPRWPERMVSEPFPHALLAEALGPALKFWHGSALTAWFLCEGPYSRTDMAGLAEYHAGELVELERLSCPIEGSLFTELVAGERGLGPSRPLRREITSADVAPGISVQMEMHVGARRAGFEKLRDIITRHRRAWSERYVEAYLRALWESELREAGREYNRLTEDGGKPPSPKQFAKHAAAATNHWFAGDLGALYRALGEKSAVSPVRVARMPADRAGFVRAVHRALGGPPSMPQSTGSTTDHRALSEQQQRYSSLTRLAEESLRYLQLEEAIGRPPTLKEFGVGKFQWVVPAMWAGLDEAWTAYQVAIDSSMRSSAEPLIECGSLDAPAPSYVETESPARPAVKAEWESDKPSWWKRLLGH